MDENRTEESQAEESQRAVRYSRVPFPQFTDRKVMAKEDNIWKLQRVKTDITVELGCTRMSVADMLRLQPSNNSIDLNDPNLSLEERKKYVLRLERQIGEPVDLLINGRVFAKGEVVSTDDGENYAVRVISILTEEQRIDEQLRRLPH